MAKGDVPPNDRDGGIVPAIVSPNRVNLGIGPWTVSVRPAVIPAIKITAALVLCGVAEWLFQNFLQLRGVVDLLASRIDLALLWAFCFAIGYVLTVGSKRKVRFRTVIAILLLAGVWGLDRWAPKSEKLAAKNDLFIELQSGEMPPAVPNGQIYYAMSPFPDGGGGLGEQIANDDDRLLWSKEIYVARQKGYQGIPVLVYRVTNYSDKTLVDVEMAPVVTYSENVVGNADGLLEEKLAKPWPITIQKIDPGPANAFVFYVLNDSTKQFLRVTLPSQATARFIGETAKRPFRVTHVARDDLMVLLPNQGLH